MPVFAVLSVLQERIKWCGEESHDLSGSTDRFDLESASAWTAMQLVAVVMKTVIVAQIRLRVFLILLVTTYVWPCSPGLHIGCI